MSTEYLGSWLSVGHSGYLAPRVAQNGGTILVTILHWYIHKFTLCIICWNNNNLNTKKTLISVTSVTKNWCIILLYPGSGNIMSKNITSTAIQLGWFFYNLFIWLIGFLRMKTDRLGIIVSELYLSLMQAYK